MEERLIKVGITHGDINGIGYEVMLKTLSDARIAELCTPVIYGSAKIAAYHRKALDLPAINLNIIAQAEEAGTIESVTASSLADRTLYLLQSAPMTFSTNARALCRKFSIQIRNSRAPVKR